MARWTSKDIPDLSGQVTVVTGANSGLGIETAFALAGAGAVVVLACRDDQRGKAAVESIRSSYPGAELQLAPLDLADLGSVRRFADSFLSAHETLDILVNNAGVMAIPERRSTADGFEMQFGTNHLGHFALTGLMLPALLKRPARVVTVSSWAHRMGRVNFDDLNSERGYRKWVAYGTSKLANLLFTYELDLRSHAAGRDLVAAAAHPGYSNTHLQKGTIFSFTNRFAQSPVHGALPSLYAATAPEVGGGDYYGPDGILQYRGYPKRVGSSGATRDGAVAKRLWDASEELTGVTYDFGPLV